MHSFFSRLVIALSLMIAATPIGLAIGHDPVGVIYAGIVLFFGAGVLVFWKEDKRVRTYTNAMVIFELVGLAYVSTASLWDGFSLWALGGDCIVVVALVVGLLSLGGSGRVQKVASRHLSY